MRLCLFGDYESPGLRVRVRSLSEADIGIWRYALFQQVCLLRCGLSLCHSEMGGMTPMAMTSSRRAQRWR